MIGILVLGIALLVLSIVIWVVNAKMFNHTAIFVTACIIYVVGLVLAIYSLNFTGRSTSSRAMVQQNTFAYKNMCQDRDGTLLWNESFDVDGDESGVLLGCAKVDEYGNPVDTIAKSEIDEIEAKINSGEYNPETEKERLELYFHIVYPKTPRSEWSRMSLQELVDSYQDLEVYYNLPSTIMPTTEKIIRREGDREFYRVPKGVILDQDPHRLGVTTPYIEVIRFGSMNNYYRDPTLFGGTYYYPSKGSGVFLPMGIYLTAFNKVHAMKLLDVPNSDIVQVGGRDFQNFLKSDSDALWETIKTSNPDADSRDYWVSACVMDKHISTQDESCDPMYGRYTKKIYYMPEALDRIINEMVAGKALRKDRNGKLVYYGIGDTGDRFLGQVASSRGYDTLQLLREAQMSISGDAQVGTEVIHLYEPVASQAYLTRLDPLERPYTYPELESIRYLQDPDVAPVSSDYLSPSVLNPFENELCNEDLIVDYR